MKCNMVVGGMIEIYKRNRDARVDSIASTLQHKGVWHLPQYLQVPFDYSFASGFR